MTREEILNMPAGETLDRAIAEHYFPAKLREVKAGIFTPSQDIKDAFEVVRKIGGDGTSVVVAYDAYNGDRWYCAINGKRMVEVYAATPELAIVRAALLAVMEAK